MGDAIILMILFPSVCCGSVDQEIFINANIFHLSQSWNDMKPYLDFK